MARNLMRRAVLLLAFLVLGAAAGTGSVAKDEPPEPKLALTASPRHGFRPVTFTLKAILSGIEPDDPDYCHAGIEWESRTPSGLTTTSMQDPKCLHPPEQLDIQYSFTKITTISRPGTYVFRAIIHKRDGEVLMSNTTEVRVLNNQ